VDEIRENRNDEFKSLDIPPPVSEAGKHGIYPHLNHDEKSRFNFQASLYKVIAKELSPGNELIYKQRVLPKIEKELGRPPKDRHEVRRAMNKDPFHNFWGALRRNTMEMRQVNGQFVTLRQLDQLASRAAELNENSDSLRLDSNIKIPAYVSEVDHHCMPGSYYRELVEGDVSPAGNYDVGFFITTGGSIGEYCDAAGRAIANWIKENHGDLAPKNILDIGSAVGNSLLPIARAFPEAKISAIDVSAPMLRYAHARSKSLGVENIDFIQMSGENLDTFEDESFDIVMTSIFLHELSAKSLPKIMSEAYRVLKPGGLMLHLEQPQYTSEMSLFEQFIRDWDSYNNSEPFWSAMHEISLVDLMSGLGFEKDNIQHAAMRAEMTKGSNKAAEDFGRDASWHAYVARKPC